MGPSGQTVRQSPRVVAARDEAGPPRAPDGPPRFLFWTEADPADELFLALRKACSRIEGIVGVEHGDGVGGSAGELIVSEHVTTIHGELSATINSELRRVLENRGSLGRLLGHVAGWSELEQLIRLWPTAAIRHPHSPLVTGSDPVDEDPAPRFAIHFDFEPTQEALRLLDRVANGVGGVGPILPFLHVENSSGTLLLEPPAASVPTLTLLHRKLIEHLDLASDDELTHLTKKPALLRESIERREVVAFERVRLDDSLDNFDISGTIDSQNKAINLEHDQHSQEHRSPRKLKDLAVALNDASVGPVQMPLQVVYELGEQLAASQPEVHAKPPLGPGVQALSQIAIHSSLISAAREALDAHVALARREGLSWMNIGKAAGIDQSVAQRRWDASSKAQHAEYQRSRSRRPPTP